MTSLPFVELHRVVLSYQLIIILYMYIMHEVGVIIQGPLSEGFAFVYIRYGYLFPNFMP